MISVVLSLDEEQEKLYFKEVQFKIIVWWIISFSHNTQHLFYYCYYSGFFLFFLKDPKVKVINLCALCYLQLRCLQDQKGCSLGNYALPSLIKLDLCHLLSYQIAWLSSSAALIKNVFFHSQLHTVFLHAAVWPWRRIPRAPSRLSTTKGSYAT